MVGWEGGWRVSRAILRPHDHASLPGVTKGVLGPNRVLLISQKAHLPSSATGSALGMGHCKVRKRDDASRGRYSLTMSTGVIKWKRYMMV